MIKCIIITQADKLKKISFSAQKLVKCIDKQFDFWIKRVLFLVSLFFRVDMGGVSLFNGCAPIPVPAWRNGRRARLKIEFHESVGSSPTAGTTYY